MGGHADPTLKTRPLGKKVLLGFDQESAFGLVHGSFLGSLSSWAVGRKLPGRCCCEQTGLCSGHKAPQPPASPAHAAPCCQKALGLGEGQGPPLGSMTLVSLLPLPSRGLVPWTPEPQPSQNNHHNEPKMETSIGQ